MNSVAAHVSFDLSRSDSSAVAFFNFYDDVTIKTLLTLYPSVRISSVKLTYVPFSSAHTFAAAAAFVSLSSSPSFSQLVSAAGGAVERATPDSGVVRLSPIPAQGLTLGLRPLSLSADPARLAYGQMGVKAASYMLSIAYTIHIAGPGDEGVGRVNDFPAEEVISPASAKLAASPINSS